MTFTQGDVVQFFEELQVPKEALVRYKAMLVHEQYNEMYIYLRGMRGKFLDDLHKSQRRLDQLDHLIYNIKRISAGNPQCGNESEVCDYESARC